MIAHGGIAMPLRALIWDVDGTLAETERDGHRIAFNRAFADAGLSWHWDAATYGELLKVTGGKERILHWWHQVDPEAAASAAAVETVRRLHAAKNAHYATLVDDGAIALRPGVERLLVQARSQGIPLAIATTTTAQNVVALLRATLGDAAPGWFDVIGAGDVVPAKKPAPDVYHWVLDRLGLHAGEVIAIEDSANGVAAAHRAGLAVVLTRSLYTVGEDTGPVLADLDGLGSDERPARGTVQGLPWQGVVDLGTLRRWLARSTVLRWTADNRV